MKASDVLALTRRHETGAANTFRLVENPPVFVRGEGAGLFDENGRRWLDLACGSSTTALGHGHPSHRAAIEELLETGILHTGTRLPSPVRARLYAAMARHLPAGLDVVHFANAGTEATEIALKAAQYATGRHRIISFEGGYHGRTAGALSVTDGPAIRAPFALNDGLVDVMPYPAIGSDPDMVAAALGRLDRTLAERGAGHEAVGAVIIEAVQGVAGVVEADGGFLRAVAARTRSAGALLIVDEIWNGFGRAGRWFAFERAGVTPDLVTVGKALSAGLPLSAVIGAAAVLKNWPPGMHTSTFQGNPLSCACALATIETLERDRLVERVSSIIEPMLVDSLAQLARLPIGRAHV